MLLCAALDCRTKQGERWVFLMGKVVGTFVALLAVAVAIVLFTGAHQTAAWFQAYQSEPLPSKIAWTVIVLVPIALALSAIWLSYALMQQRRAGQALAVRLDGVRDGVKSLVKTQIDAETAVHQLTRTDPEDAMATMQQRLTEAERFAHIQQSRNESADLQSRVDYIRAQQLALQDRLAPVLEKRQAIEQAFAELRGRQNDIDHALAEIASGDDGIVLDVGLKNMMEFIRRSHLRCDEVDQASKIIAGLKEDFGELRSRLAPFAAAEGGVLSRVRELRDARDRLTGDMDSLLQLPEGPLAERLGKFANDKRVLDGRLAELNEEFSRLATLRRDIGGFFAAFSRALDTLSITRRGDQPSDVDARTEELTNFISATQAHIDDIEHRLATFSQLKMKLGELDERIVPLESEDSGVIRLIEELRESRDKLAAKIRRMEESDDGDLTERVRRFTDSKRELEERVTRLNEQFLKLAEIRKDIAGLFDKLSSSVSASAN